MGVFLNHHHRCVHPITGKYKNSFKIITIAILRLKAATKHSTFLRSAKVIIVTSRCVRCM